MFPALSMNEFCSPKLLKGRLRRSLAAPKAIDAARPPNSHKRPSWEDGTRDSRISYGRFALRAVVSLTAVVLLSVDQPRSQIMDYDGRYLHVAAFEHPLTD